MAKELPYLPSYKNLAKLFEKIETAKTPDAFTTRYLAETLGLKSTGDRAFINILKKLGFLDTSGKPTKTYPLLKNKATARKAIADGIRSAYEALFASNINAHKLNSEDLKGLVSQVAGTEQGMTNQIAYTFNALAKLGDFDAKAGEPPEEVIEDKKQQDDKTQQRTMSLSSEFHFNIQVHLPANGTEETYLNIFNALRKSFS